MSSIPTKLKDIVKNKQFIKASKIIEEACRKYKEFLKNNKNEID